MSVFVCYLWAAIDNPHPMLCSRKSGLLQLIQNNMGCLWQPAHRLPTDLHPTLQLSGPPLYSEYTRGLWVS